MRRCPPAACLVLAALAAGCGGSGNKVKVTGQLQSEGKPLTLHTSVMRTMSFSPPTEGKDGAGGKSYSAVVNDDGTFEVADIPAGKYLITLELIGDRGDLCGGALARGKSKLVRDVTGAAPLVLDVGKVAGQ